MAKKKVKKVNKNKKNKIKKKIKNKLPLKTFEKKMQHFKVVSLISIIFIIWFLTHFM